MKNQFDRQNNLDSTELRDPGSGAMARRFPSGSRSKSICGDIEVVIPVFDDWGALSRILEEIDCLTAGFSRNLGVLVVDDASTEECPRALVDRQFNHIQSVDLVRLSSNLGHQRAIAVGLVEAARMPTVGAVLVMDADGEDRPVDLVRLLAQADRSPDAVICAQRQQRSEGLSFRAFYCLYKMIFYLLTGARIDFGNYCLLPRRVVEILIHNPAIWNNLAAAICRSRLPLVRLPTKRGTRYEGRSHMNFVALVLHGFTAISVYSDLVMVRIVLCMTVLCGTAFAALIVVVGLRLFTTLAIPGWASGVGGLLVIIILQSLLIAAIAAFQVIGVRSTKPIIPSEDAASLISGRWRIAGDPVAAGKN